MSNLPKSTVQQALDADSRKKNSRLYQGVTPERAERTSEIVAGELNNLVSSMNRAPCRYDDLATIQARTLEYLQGCVAAQTVPLIESWAVSLGISRKCLYEWFDRSKNTEVAEFLERVRSAIISANMGAAYAGATNPVVTIFYSKNAFGFSDRTEVNINAQSTVDPMGDQTPAEELQRKYLEAIESPTGEE